MLVTEKPSALDCHKNLKRRGGWGEGSGKSDK